MSYNSTLLNTTNSWCNVDWETVDAVRFYTSIATSVAAFAGNVLVILVVYQVMTLRTTSNYFIVNMAVSDMFLPAANLFYTIFFVQKQPGNLSGPTGTVLCKFFRFFCDLSYGVSMFSLVVITVDRFYAVVFPMRARVQNRRTTVKLLICSWFIPTATFSPWLFVTYFHSKTQFCLITLRTIEVVQIYVSIHASLFFLPLIIMVVLYSVIIVQVRRQKIPGNATCPQALIRRKKQNLRLTTMFITIASAFTLTWGSAHVVRILSLTAMRAHLCTFVRIYFFVSCLPLVFHAVNPVLYFIFCQSYRQGIKQVQFSCCCHHSNQAGHQAPGGDQIQLDNLPAQA